MHSEQEKYNRMTMTPVPSLVMQLAIPTMISMLITTLYNTADTFFVSKISVSASGATGIVFSLMAILQAFGFMYGHGAGSNVSRLLGAKDVDRASVFSSTSFFLAIGTGIVILVLGLTNIRAFMYLLGSTDTILSDAISYATYILIAAPALITSCVMNNILRYEGMSLYSMIGLASGGILNIILDPIFIFVFHLGTAGAGMATALSQFISFTLLLLPFLTGKTSSKISISRFTRSFSDIINIVLTGFPSMLRQGLNSICIAVLNSQAAFYGDYAIAAMSICNRIVGLMYSLFIGIGQGFQPVAAFNYGAHKYDRVRKAFLFTLFAAFGVTLCSSSICRIYSNSIIRLFRSDPEVVSTGTQALRYACNGMLILPISGIGGMLFQSTGNKWRAMMIASLQSGLIFLPLLFILPAYLGIQGIEMAQPIAFAIAGIISIPFILHFLLYLKRNETAPKERDL